MMSTEYRIAESLYCIPETKITLYVNYTGIKNLKIVYYISVVIKNI